MTRLSFALTDDAGQAVWLDDVEKEYLESLELSEQDASHTKEAFYFWKEFKLLLSIALPAVAVQFSLTFIFPQTASLVGRQLGALELAGFSLGSLVGNLTCLSVMVGALTAADTLMPRAYGTEQYSELGLLAIRSLVICSLLLVVPIIPLCTIMEIFFDLLGQDEVASRLASHWIRIYLVGVPASMIFRVVQSFLNAQHKVWPMVYSSVFACFFIHPFILKACVGTLGFIGSSLAIALTQCVMAFLLLLYLKVNPVYAKESWPGVSKSFFLEAISPIPMMKFLSLSLGGVVSLSEWWFWETVCFVVGSFGVVPLCVHTIAYNLVPLLFMVPLGIMIGLQVRMGHLISFDVKKAKLLAAWCMLFTSLLGLAVALVLYKFQVEITMLFTKDENVIHGCKAIWPKLCYYIFILYIFGVNSAILRALGMQWRMAAIIFLCLWLATLPTLFVVAVRGGGGIDAVWNILPLFYTVMQGLLAWCYMSADWSIIGRKIRTSVLEKIDQSNYTTEQTRLISSSSNEQIRQI